MVLKIEGVEITDIEDFYEIYEPIIPDNRKEDFLDYVLDNDGSPEIVALTFLYLCSDLTYTDVRNYNSGVGMVSDASIRRVKKKLSQELDIGEENEYDEIPSPEEYRQHRYHWFTQKDSGFKARYSEKLKENATEIVEDVINV